MKKIDYIVKSILDDFTHKNVLEIGCGGADLSLNLVNIANRVVAIDIDDKRISDDAKNLVEFYKCNAIKTSFDEKTFDTIIAYNAAYHLKDDLLGILNESKRILKPSGRIIFVSTWSIDKSVIFEDIPTVASNLGLTTLVSDNKFYMCYLKIN